jgi:hypothetical protein
MIFLGQWEIDRHFLCFIMGLTVFDKKDEWLAAEKRKRKREKKKIEFINVRDSGKPSTPRKPRDGCKTNKALFGFWKE